MEFLQAVFVQEIEIFLFQGSRERIRQSVARFGFRGGRGCCLPLRG